MKQFDDIFRENVEKAFSNYNADHLADEAWNSFAALKKGRRRRAAMIPLWARAASVLLIIGLGIFIAYFISSRHIAREVISGTEYEGKKNEAPVVYNETVKKIIPGIAQEKEPLKKEIQPEKREPEALKSFIVSDSFPEVMPLNHEGTLLTDIDDRRSLIPDARPDIYSARELKVLPELKITGNLISANLTFEDLKPAGKEPDQEKHHRGITIMAGFSGLIAQSKSSGTASPASGLSVGFYLDQKITDNISIRPGLALARQSLGIEDGKSMAGFNNAMSLYDGTKGTPYSYDGHLNMLAMELPLNIVFRIVEKGRSGLYVSAGASSMIYISQQFTAEYVNEYTKQSYNALTSLYSSETRYSTVEVENDYGAFSRADIFGLANLSAGYIFAYSKTSTLLIEPFLQLPVSDLTSLNLRVKYGGLSMKLRFGKQEQEK